MNEESKAMLTNSQVDKNSEIQESYLVWMDSSKNTRSRITKPYQGTDVPSGKSV